jgi:hypothetical protein
VLPTASLYCAGQFVFRIIFSSILSGGSSMEKSLGSA